MNNEIASNIYLKKIISSRTPQRILPNASIAYAINFIKQIIGSWAGKQLSDIKLSGSYSKNTAIIGSTDVDLFISLKSDTTTSLKDIYYSLANILTNRGFSTRLQNVSIGIECRQVKVDLVPGVRHSPLSSYHSIYKRKKDSWTQTNVDQHQKIIKESNRLEEIRALKIWRELNQLDFPSFYLELTVLDALRGCSYNNISKNFLKILEYLSNNFFNARVVDPANTKNIISDDLTDEEKKYIVDAASLNLLRPYWDNIIW